MLDSEALVLEIHYSSDKFPRTKPLCEFQLRREGIQDPEGLLPLRLKMEIENCFNSGLKEGSYCMGDLTFYWKIGSEKLNELVAPWLWERSV